MRGGLEPSWNGDVGLATLNPQPVFPELYYPLWWYSGSSVSTSSTTVSSITKGSTAPPYGTTALFTLSSSFLPNTTFALEACVAVTNSSDTLTVHLVDVTTSTTITTITTSSTTFNIVRTGKFNLTPSHSFALTIISGLGTTVKLTDASLIIFPQAPLTSPSVSSISLANPSGNTLKESYYPLWIYGSGNVNWPTSIAGSTFVVKGSTSYTQSTTASNGRLYTLSSAWSPNQKFAFEASFWTSSAGDSAISLWDMTTNTLISNSLIITSSTTATLIRSGQFALTAGHSYGISMWYTSGSSVNAYLTKAHLVALA